MDIFPPPLSCKYKEYLIKSHKFNKSFCLKTFTKLIIKGSGILMVTRLFGKQMKRVFMPDLATQTILCTNYVRHDYRLKPAYLREPNIFLKDMNLKSPLLGQLGTIPAKPSKDSNGMLEGAE